MPFITETGPRIRGEHLQLQVMQTAELFELILLNVDMRTLITSAQRVDRHWNQTIRDSPSLQRALFFLPSDKAGSCIAAAKNKSVRDSLDVHHETPMTPIRNPLLAELFPAFFGKPGDYLPGEHAFGQQPFAKRRETFMAPGATWRRMLVQQNPPIRTIGRWKRDDNYWKRGSATARLYVCGGDGLNMGQYYDLAERNVVLEDREIVYWTTADSRGFVEGQGKYKPSRDPEDDYGEETEAADGYAAQKLEFVSRVDLVLEQVSDSGGFRPCCGSSMTDRDWRPFMAEYSYKGKGETHEVELEEVYSWKGGQEDTMDLVRLDNCP